MNDAPGKKCSCPLCANELKNKCFGPGFCGPCRVIKAANVKICPVCKAEYLSDYGECPACLASKK